MTAHRSAPTVLRCSTTADFLAALPLLTGFTARNSLFVVFFSEHRATQTMRLDLPPDESPASVAPLLDFICSALAHFGLGSPAIVITTDTSFAEARGAPWRRLAGGLERRLRRDGFAPRELCCVAVDGWVSFLDPQAPLLGRPLSEVERSRVSQRRKAPQRHIPDLDDLGKLPSRSSSRTTRVSQALAQQRPYTTAHAGETAWLYEVSTVCRSLLNSEGQLAPFAAAALLRTLERPERWAPLAIGLLTRPDFPCELAEEFPAGSFARISVQAHGPDTRASFWSLSHLLSNISPDPASRHSLAHVRDILLHTAADAPPPLRAVTLAFSAWLWWVCGNQTVAQRQARLAFDSLPQSREPDMNARSAGESGKDSLALVTMATQLVTQPPSFFPTRLWGDRDGS